MVIKYSNEDKIFELKEHNKVLTLSFKVLDAVPFVKHSFSTREGGVSIGEFTSMNLSFARGDDHYKVYENFRRITKELGAAPEDIVFCKQTHTNKVVYVDESHKGRVSNFYNECIKNEDIRKDHSGQNISKLYAFEEVDGMITDIPGVCLFTSYADCVPLYFVDPVKKAIGLSHSGWRGTVGKIGAVTVEAMVREFESNPRDIIATIGPCICQSCYEVSEDVINEFINTKEIDRSTNKGVSFIWEDETVERFARSRGDGKYQLDLRKANELILLEAGILPKNISITNVCTACNHELLFSHRISIGKRGNLGAFLMIKS